MDIFATATKVEPDDKLARIIGVNMEGPLIDIAKKALRPLSISVFLTYPFPSVQRGFRKPDQTGNTCS